MELGTESQHENCACTAVTVTVDDSHVRHQLRGNGYMCAVALAIREHLTPGIKPAVSRYGWQIQKNWGEDSYWQFLELGTRRFIASLDAGLDIDLPYTFTAHIPNLYLKGGQH
jgi:hypothetical protein